MKIPLSYPKIPSTKDCPLKKCIVFEKLDGTNLHFGYENDHFFCQGTRRNRYDLSDEGRKSFEKKHPELAHVFDDHIKLFSNMERFLKTHDKFMYSEKIILFMEYLGAKSFAGQHDEKDPTKTLYLIDAEVDGKLLSPEDFLREFVDWQYLMPKVIYQGKYSGQLVEDIRSGKFLVDEGAVIKGTVNGNIYMAKVKTNKYMEKLKMVFSDQWLEYWE